MVTISKMETTSTRRTIPKMKHLEGCIVYYLKKLLTTSYLDRHSTTDSKLEIVSAVSTGNGILSVGRNVRGIAHMQRQLSITHHES